MSLCSIHFRALQTYPHKIEEDLKWSVTILDTWIGIVFLVVIVNIISLFAIKKDISILAFILLILVTIISAVRSDIGEDYSGYIGWFSVCDITQEILPYPEVSFQILATLIQKANLSYQCMFAFYSIMISAFIWKSAKIYVKDRKYVLLYISLWVIAAFDIGWWYSMNVIRQYLAVTILLYAYRYLIEKENKKYITWCLIAAFIHVSALAMLVLPILLKMKISKKIYAIFIGVAIVLSFTSFKHIWMQWILSTVGIYENYIDFAVGDTYAGLGLSSYFFLIQAVFLMKKLNWDIRDEYVIGVFISLCTIMKFILVRPYTRMCAFFSIAFIVAWIILLCKNKIKQKSILIASIVLLYSATFLYDINATVGGHDTDWRPSAGNIDYKVNLNFSDDG